jgi:hypothetical protein
MSFPDQEAFEAATRTPQWEALRSDSASMIERFGVRLLTGMGEPQVVDVASKGAFGASTGGSADA